MVIVGNFFASFTQLLTTKLQTFCNVTVDGFVLIKGFPQQFSKQHKKATELKNKKRPA